MIKDFIKRRSEKKAIREWHNSFLGKMLASHTDKYFTTYPYLADLSPDFKSKIVEDFYGQIFNLSKAENPFLAMREMIASYVFGLTELQVLCITEEEKAEAFFADCPYISGQIYHQIDQVVIHVNALREFKWKNPEITNNGLISFCNCQSLLYKYYLNGFNYVRSELFDDFDATKDWLQPFIKSMLIWHEEQIRLKIGLNSLLPNCAESLKYSTFMNMVVEGYKNPYYEWEKKWC